MPVLVSCFSRWTVAYQTSDKKLLLEIKCPHTKRHMSPIDLVQDPNFYVNLENGKSVPKKSHSTGYYSQIQLAMGLSDFDTCDFVVYTFKGLIIVRTEFDVFYFDSLIQKLNSFYKKIYVTWNGFKLDKLTKASYTFL